MGDNKFISSLKYQNGALKNLTYLGVPIQGIYWKELETIFIKLVNQQLTNYTGMFFRKRILAYTRKNYKENRRGLENSRLPLEYNNSIRKTKKKSVNFIWWG